MIKIPEPDYSDDKEVYAFFGLASYYSQIIEQGILNITVALKLRENNIINPDTINKEFDCFEKKTLGYLIHEIKKEVPNNNNFEIELKKILGKRNYLAHSFYVNHDCNILEFDGRIKMIDELREIISLFKEFDKKMDKIMMRLWKKYGFTEDLRNKLVYGDKMSEK
jgi:hypothetical protein